MPTFLYTWKIIYPSFVTNFGLNSPRSSEIAHFQSMFVPSASAVARSKKVQLTLIGCFVRFPLSQYLVRSVTLYVFLLVIYRVTFARTKKFLAYIIYLFIEGHQIFLVHTDTEKLALPHWAIVTPRNHQWRCARWHAASQNFCRLLDWPPISSRCSHLALQR